MKTRAAPSILLVVVMLVVAAVAEAQHEPKKVPRIGFLAGFGMSIDSFRQGLEELGHIEGQNIYIEYRFAEGQPDRELELARELVKLKVDVIVTSSTSRIRAAKQATRIIPIVFGAAGDPVGTGLVESLARPGGNVTGLSNLSEDLTGKRLEIIKEAFPKVTRAAILSGGTTESSLMSAEAAAKTLAVQVQPLTIRDANELEGAFETVIRRKAQAILFSGGQLLNGNRRQVLELAAKTRLPTMYWRSEFVVAGGLMSYATDDANVWRRAAVYVDKILKGAKAGELPVEQPTKFEFIVNLKTAKQIGLTIPANVLARADKVIK
jgi:putative tryptophan/tyrosine transport system substrate-binding protein